MNTRGLTALVANRICSEAVTLEYVTTVEEEYDGSAEIVFESVVVMVSITPLQPKDIQRLAIAGITVKNGITVAMPFGTAIPDRVIRGDEYSAVPYRVVAFSDEENVPVCTCDLITVELSE